MRDDFSSTRRKPRLRAGEWVEVRSAQEILDTLDQHGRLDDLPFMPEMLRFCGQRYRVFKSAHKTCDTINSYKGRRMTAAVHLERLRCDGSAHGGCQAGCLLFWKEAWLRRVRGTESGGKAIIETRPVDRTPRAGADLETLARSTRKSVTGGDAAKERYSCQATDLLEATMPLPWWDPRQYIVDLASGNVSAGDFIRYAAIATFNAIMRIAKRNRSYPSVGGRAQQPPRIEPLDLHLGELVQVRPRDEIMRTIDADRKNRGLWFDVEMEPFCGKTFRVLDRVERIIDEKTGKMLHISRDCIILEGVACSGCLSRNRLFCPRSIYSYWREAWLKRVA